MLRPLEELGSNNLSLHFSVDGRLLFAGSQNGDVQIWSVPSSRIEQRLHPATSPVRILMQDAAGSKLLVAQCDSYTVIQGRPCRIGLWNVADWKEQKSWVTSGYRLACAISPEGSWVATGDPWQPVQVWNVKGAGPATNPVSFSMGTVTDLAFSPNGLLLAAANEEGTVRIWKLPSLSEVAAFRAHPHTVQTLAFSPDSQRLATAGDGEEAIKIWELNTWQELLTLEQPGRTIKRLAFSPDGGRLFALNDQGDLLLWRVPSWREIESSQERNPRREIPQ
jgi:WD40 repeat protein